MSALRVVCMCGRSCARSSAVSRVREPSWLRGSETSSLEAADDGGKEEEEEDVDEEEEEASSSE